ncbi:MAG: DUF4105 domain-containing protein [Bdellovibrionia bacterium]
MQKPSVFSYLFLPTFFALVSTASGSAWAEDQVGCDHTLDAAPVTSELMNLAQDVIDVSSVKGAYGPNDSAPECIKDTTDPYDPAYKITYGDYNGQCIDGSTVRPPLVLKQDDKQITIANFYHNGKYWVASIPKNAVSSVMFQGVPFDSVLFGLIQFKHGQFRFKLNQPIVLREQAGNKTETATVDDLIVSSTATRPKGIEYSVLKGKNFGIATRVLSPTSRGVEEIAVDKSRVHQYELKMDPQAMSDFLVTSIVRAKDAGYQDMYKLLDNNCATVAFDSLDAAIPRPSGVQPFRGKWWLIRDEIERPSLQALKERHISFTRVQDMNEEMTCAQAGEALDGSVVDPSTLGAAAGRCRMNPLSKPLMLPN